MTGVAQRGTGGDHVGDKVGHAQLHGRLHGADVDTTGGHVGGHHDAHAVDQVVKLLRHQAELFEYFRQFQDLFLSGSVTATFRFDGVTRYNVLSA